MVFDHRARGQGFYYDFLPEMRTITLSTNERVRLYFNERWLKKIGACVHCYGPAGNCEMSCMIKQDNKGPRVSGFKRPRSNAQASASSLASLYD